MAASLGLTVDAPVAESNREQWLQSAAALLGQTEFAGVGIQLPPARISVGFPHGGGKGSRSIGQCWNSKCASDGLSQIFIHPQLIEGVDVIGVLIHELVHASVGTEAGHRAPFRKVATAIGLEGKMTATTVGAELAERVNSSHLPFLGPYPHAALQVSQLRKKQVARMIKMECLACGYVARAARKWIEEAGAVSCPCNGEPMEVEVKDDD
jgi:hypothetical protein